MNLLLLLGKEIPLVHTSPCWLSLITQTGLFETNVTTSIEIKPLLPACFALSLVTLHGNLLLAMKERVLLKVLLNVLETMAGCTFPPNFNTQRRAKVSPERMTTDPKYTLLNIQPGVPPLSHCTTALSCTPVDPSS